MSLARFHPRKPLFWCAAVALSLGAYFLLREPTPVVPPPPNPWAGPVPIKVFTVTEADLTVELRAIGSVTPLNQVTLKSRVAGPITRIAFTEGQMVKEGDLLIEIDPAPYRVKLQQSEASLRETIAQLKNAEQDLALYQTLYKQKNVAKQQLDKQIALAEQLQGSRAVQEALVADARLQLGYTQIHAPISGRVGLRKVDIGNLVNANDSQGLVSITQTHPIAVSFTVPENQLVEVRKAHQNARKNGGYLTVDAFDRSERELLSSGHLTTLDNQIDTQTGTLKVKATFDNQDDSLFPNQFINARLHVMTLKDQVVIPTDAVQFGSKGTYVYVIRDDKSHIQTVKLGPSQAARTVVLEGIAVGDKIVLEGYDQLREGRQVKVLEDSNDLSEILSE
jgi:multidrug efflux system membrane fusion protein